MVELDKRAKGEAGFSLLELLISLAVFVVISGAIIGSMGYLQKNYRGSEIRTTLEQKMRAALELMAQEISQAGLQPSGVDTDGLGAALTTATAAISAGSTAAVQVSTIAGIYQYEWLRIDAGPGPNCYGGGGSGPCERMQVHSVSAGPPATITFYGSFQYAHVANTPIFGMGSYPQGVVPPGLSSPPASGGSSSSQLEVFGDLNGAGNSFLAVIYACPSTFPGPFKRTLYDATSGSQISSINLIDNVTACSFTYPATLPTVNIPVCNQASTQVPVVLSVGITLTAQSTMNDPQTGQPITLTKSFLNIQPRNVVAAYNWAGLSPDTAANELQPMPCTVP